MALALQNQSKVAFPSETRKNPKDCMAVTQRSGRELDERRVEKKENEEEKHVEIGEELKQHYLEIAEEDRTTKMQQEQQTEKMKSKEEGRG